MQKNSNQIQIREKLLVIYGKGKEYAASGTVASGAKLCIIRTLSPYLSDWLFPLALTSLSGKLYPGVVN